MLKNLTKFLFVLSFVSFTFPIFLLAQTNIPYALSDELNIEVSPSNPKPNQKVSVSLALYTGDLNSAYITWTKNGKTVLEGTGETKYSFVIGQAGTETSIKISVKLANGIIFSKSFSLNPTSVDLVWESDSYVPPFYKGKALHTKQGLLKIVASPNFVINGKQISPNNLVYKWSNEVRSFQDQSGYGKNVLILGGSLFGRSENIRIKVTDPVNNLSAENSIIINPIDPEIVFYENDPYYGFIFDSAVIESYDLKNKEVQFFAAPFYFTRSDYGLKYSWRLNNQELSNLSDSVSAIFRKPETESGRSLISLSVENPEKILQQANKNITINFKE